MSDVLDRPILVDSCSYRRSNTSSGGRSLLRRNSSKDISTNCLSVSSPGGENDRVDIKTPLPVPRRRLSESPRRGSRALSLGSLSPSNDASEARSHSLSTLMLRRGSTDSRRDSVTSPRISFSSVNQEVELVRSSIEIEQQSKLSAALSSINKLKFESLGLVGRKAETQTLQDCLSRLCSNNDGKNHVELVLLHGLSGTGKTSLAYSLKDSLRRQNGTFVRGKYNKELNEQPLAGISVICNELCREALYMREPELVATMRRDILASIDMPLVEMLENLIPLLSVILTTEGVPLLPSVAEKVTLRRPSAASSDTSRRSGNGKESSKNSIARFISMASRRTKVEDSSQSDSTIRAIDTARKPKIEPSQSKQLLEFALRTLLRIFSSHLGPVVMVLDDLQFADVASSEMLKAIADDISIPRLMIIACYRSDEIDETHVLAKTIRDIHSGAGKSQCHLTEISIGNLTLDSVNEMISELLSVAPEKTMDLSSICFKRTLGNAFFVKVFLLMLHDFDILEFNIGNFQWTWNLAKVEQETAATDNVVSMIKMKIDKYPDGMVLLLSLAARLGNTFESSTIRLLWDFMEEKYHGTLEGVDTLLEVAIREMLIESVGDETYRFVHDKVQETAMQLIPKEEHVEFRTDMGKILYENLPDHALENMLFVVANLLNDGAYEGLEIALLNARAAEKAIKLSAFQSAVHYVEFGLMSLNHSDMWTEHRDLSLQLFSTGAEAEECAGNSDKSDWYCQEVLRKDFIPIVNKMRVIKLSVERLYNNGKYEELWVACLDTLHQLGCSLPCRKAFQRVYAAIAIHQIKTTHMPMAFNVEEMDMMNDLARREAMSLMLKAASFCLACKNKTLYILLCCRCIRWTQKYGLTEYTASAFASFANVLMHSYNDWSTAIKVAETAFFIESRVGSNYTKTSTLHKLNSFVLGWVKPLRSCRTNYLEAYKVGMLSGNIEAVGMAILFFLICEFFSGGHKLQGLDEDLRNYIPQLEKLRLHSYVLGLRLLWQKVLNLMGAPYNPQTVELKGTAMHGIDIERHPFIYNTVGRHHICNLCAYFSEYKKGAEVAIGMGDSFYETWSGAAYFGFEPFPRALCLYAMAIDTRQSKYLTAAKKVRSTITKWVRSGAINLVHQMFILDAEDAVAKGNEHAARKAYGKAIAASVRGGFIQDAGIANERFGAYLLSLGLDSDARYHVKEAIRCFSEWGATRKVTLLREDYVNLLTGRL